MNSCLAGPTCARASCISSTASRGSSKKPPVLPAAALAALKASSVLAAPQDEVRNARFEHPSRFALVAAASCARRLASMFAGHSDTGANSPFEVLSSLMGRRLPSGSLSCMVVPRFDQEDPPARQRRLEPPWFRRDLPILLRAAGVGSGTQARHARGRPVLCVERLDRGKKTGCSLSNFAGEWRRPRIPDFRAFLRDRLVYFGSRCWVAPSRRAAVGPHFHSGSSPSSHSIWPAIGFTCVSSPAGQQDNKRCTSVVHFAQSGGLTAGSGGVSCPVHRCLPFGGAMIARWVRQRRRRRVPSRPAGHSCINPDKQAVTPPAYRLLRSSLR